jgi:sugar (pentulose or hexulose) kinase
MAERGLRYVALDFGAESGRTIVGRFDGDQLSIEPVHRYANTPVKMGGTLYWDFPRQFGDVLAGMQRAAADGPVHSVSVDTWGVDYGFIDARGRLIGNPVHYRDTRHESMLEEAFKVVPREEIYRATGIQFMSINTLYQLLSEVHAADPILEQADKLLMMPDIFNHFLCGADVAEYTEASTGQTLDPWTRDWARPLFDKLGIPTHFLPEIVEPGTVIGSLLNEVADATGCARARVVAGASHDTPSAVAGTPLEGHSTAFISSGTWSLVGLEVHDPVVTDASLAANLTNEGGYAGTITLLKNVMGLWLVQQSRRALWPGEGAPSYQEICDLAEKGPQWSAFVDPDDPRFLWPGDIPTRVREYCEETGQPVPFETATLWRVIFESLALKYASVVDQLGRVTGRDIERIHIVGGGSQNELLCQMTANASKRQVVAGPAEATAIGNIAIQAITSGEIGDLDQARQLIARSFPMKTYEPTGFFWREAQERFAELLKKDD